MTGREDFYISSTPLAGSLQTRAGNLQRYRWNGTTTHESVMLPSLRATTLGNAPKHAVESAGWSQFAVREMPMNESAKNSQVKKMCLSATFILAGNVTFVNFLCSLHSILRLFGERREDLVASSELSAQSRRGKYRDRCSLSVLRGLS
jgi:hypothetical protein